MASAPKVPSSPQNRISRDGDDRSMDERPKEWMPPSQRSVVNHTDDYTVRWLRTEYNGQKDTANMEKKLSEGYELVSPDDPIVAEKIARGELKATNGRVEKGGLVLAKIPRGFAEKRNAHYTREAQLHQQSVDQALANQRHSSMPLDSDLQRSTSREG